MNWLRKMLGLCPHDWRFVERMMSAEGHDRYYDRPMPAIELGEVAKCRLCGAMERRWHPDGH